MKTIFKSTPEVVHFSVSEKVIFAIGSLSAIVVINHLPIWISGAILALAELGEGLSL